MASAATSLPGQQPLAAAGQIVQPNINIPQAQAVPSTSYSNWHSSGSIGPFFGVISVLAVLAILSCILGRVCTGGARAPLHNVKFRGYTYPRWMRRKGPWSRGGGDVELGAKAIALGHQQEKQGGDDVKAKDGEVDPPEP
ncbi:hypothetical protein M5689_004134 [Euphorbia peplus]|nr:hypothetical protein M5689_004134 [Euphorbia peplus]